MFWGGPWSWSGPSRGYGFTTLRLGAKTEPMHKFDSAQTATGRRLIVKQAVNQPLLASYLLTLSPRQQLLAAYKRLFRLRHFITDARDHASYHNLLRRRFARQNFTRRRDALLGPIEPVSALQWARRLANTCLFVFNATCDLPTLVTEVHFWLDLQQALQQRQERQILQTMLTMERQAPDRIKYDHTYSWVEEVLQFYAEAGTELPKKEINRLANLKKAHWVGFLQYERNLMALNESLGLCL